MTRPRGYAPWRPQAKTVALIDQVTEVLAEYRQFWPLTIRQTFYRLVGAHDYPKDEQAYKRLQEHMNRARRAGLIPWGAIRDDGAVADRPAVHPPWREFARSLVDPALADVWRPDPWAGQPHRVEVWCEAAGMVPMLARAAGGHVPVYSGGGFSSVTAHRDAGVRIARRAVPTVLLHVGDHDPSGVHVFGSLGEDVTAFTEAHGGTVDYRRVAVLPEHIAEYGLPTAPPKAKDNREFDGDETVQAEALPPDILARLVGQAVDALIVDRAGWDAGLAQADDDRARLGEALARMADGL